MNTENMEPVLTSLGSSGDSGGESKRKKIKFSNDAWLVAGASLLGAILICATIIWSNGGLPEIAVGGGDTKGPSVPNAKKMIDDDVILGNKNAKVTIVEFSDFQCPFCRKFWSETLPQIKKDYIDTGKVNLVYRDFPLSFHPAAKVSAEATGCAADQGKYWEMHDKIFSEQAKKGTGTIQYTETDLKKWATQIGLDAAKFNSCLDSGKYTEEVAKDAEDGAKFGVSGTPFFFVGGQSVNGAYPFATFKTAIDAELAK
jgi:protein-disulfide isomerase